MLNEYYLVKRIEDKKEEGLSFAKAFDNFSFIGEVVKLPNNRSYNLSIGDKVMFLKDTGDDVEYEGETMKVINGKDLIMKL